MLPLPRWSLKPNRPVICSGRKLKDQYVKKISSLLAFAGLVSCEDVQAISLDDIQLWAGSGTNRAALVVEWSVPESAAGSSVPAPVTDKTLVWGYRFNGAATGSQMLTAVLAADPRLYVKANMAFGTYVEAIGYNLNDNGLIGITDGTKTNSFTNGLLTNGTVNVDGAAPLNRGDLYWGGYFGPNWEVWNEAGDAGGFLSSPNRGTYAYWTADDPSQPYSGAHGQWELAQLGLDNLPLTNGSWIGFSVAAGAYDSDTNAPYNLHKHAPPSPDGTYVAYVCNTNDFAVEITGTNNVYAIYPYNDPNAMLGRPTMKFVDHFGDKQTHRAKIVEAPYWTDPNTNTVITEINDGGQVTVRFGRKIYDDPNNPYGVDLIVYGNSFLSASGFSGFLGDGTDLDVAKLSSGYYGHATTVSVSQDGLNWFAFPNTQSLYPDGAYRWDATNHSWTAEEMNPTKPLNPFLYTNNFGGQPVASELDQFVGAAGGSGYDLKAVGLPWIQYVRVSPGAGSYTVIDAIAAANPVAVGDALCLSPDNLASGITNLVFQRPDDPSENLISINLSSLDQTAKISTVSLKGFSSFGPVVGAVSAAYQIQARPVAGTSAVSFLASVALHAGQNYSGNGGDLRLWQWAGTNWVSQPFAFNTNKNEVCVGGVTNFSAFVISQIVPPQLTIQSVSNGFALQFIPVANCAHTLERSSDLAAWVPVSTFTATNTQPITLQDTAAPADKAYYRVKLNL